MLATVFVVSALTVYLWRQFIAVRFDARATAMAAYLFAALGASSMWFASSLESAHFTAILIGMGFAGIFLMDNVLLADVVDEDEARTGTRREAMYFGVSSMAGPLALAIVSVVFGAVSSTFGYDPTLDAQPASVALGFRLFITLTPTISLIAAAIVIYFYPLHGERLRRIKQTLLARRTPVRE
jgi:GPH family glycoside/pentoside/hexuronide:cation symporter